jgi:hypothetical protein
VARLRSGGGLGFTRRHRARPRHPPALVLMGGHPTTRADCLDGCGSSQHDSAAGSSRAQGPSSVSLRG